MVPQGSQDPEMLVQTDSLQDSVNRIDYVRGYKWTDPVNIL
jgi:hypothetical protein